MGHEFKDFDIWVKAGGPNRAYIETVPVEVTNGEFRIVFTAQVENPAIKAIEIMPQAEAGAGAASPAATVRINAGVSAPFTDSSGQVWQADTGFEGGMTNPGVGGFGGGPGGRQGGPGGREVLAVGAAVSAVLERPTLRPSPSISMGSASTCK